MSDEEHGTPSRGFGLRWPMTPFFRPHRSIPDDSIPLYLVGPNKAGFWIVWEVNGRVRGSFPDEVSAMRFARTQTGERGCAVMLVPEGIDVDLVPRAA